MSAAIREGKRLTAFHEAGHAVMAELCGQHITKVEIEGDSEHSGSVQSLRFEPDPQASYDRSARTIALIKDAGATKFAFVGNAQHREFGR